VKSDFNAAQPLCTCYFGVYMVVFSPIYIISAAWQQKIKKRGWDVT